MKKLFIMICVLLIALMCFSSAVFAEDEDYGNHGQDAHSESMTVGPDGTAEGALEAPEGYADEQDIDINELEPENKPAEEAAEPEETDRSFWLEGGALCLILAAAGCVLIKNKKK